MGKGSRRIIRLLGVVTLVTSLISLNTSAFADDKDRSGEHGRTEFEKEGMQALKDRESWFQKRHSLPDGTYSTSAYLNALEQAKKLPNAPHNPSVTPRGTGSYVGGTWSELGPAPIVNGGGFGNDSMPCSGRITAIATAPDGTIYVGGADGGVWSSKNGGQTWTPLTDSQPSLAIGAIAVDPKNPKILYAGTGEAHLSVDSYFGRGLLKSTDGGRTWNLYASTQFGGEHIAAVVVDPNNDANVYVASDSGIYKSTNFGVSFHRVLGGGMPSMASDLKMDPLNPSVLYAALMGNGIYKTVDGGAHWTQLTDPNFPDGSTFSTVSLAIGTYDSQQQPADNVIYAAFADVATGDLQGLYKSADSGDTWTKLDSTPDYFDIGYSYGDPNYTGVGQGWYDNCLAVDPSDPNHVFAGGITLVESTDGGQTWTNDGPADPGKSKVGIHPDMHALTFDSSGNLLVGNDGGVWEKTSAGNWSDLNTNLGVTQFYPGITSFMSGQDRRIIGGTQDNGTNEYTGSSAWSQINGGDGGFTAVDPTDSNVMYSEMDEGFLEQSRDGGATWQPIGPQFGPYENVPFITPFILSPTDHNTILLGAGYLYKGTYDQDQSSWDWQTISPDFSSEYGISFVAQAATDPNYIYVGTNMGSVYATTDGGNTWNNITPRYADFLPVSGIVVNPNNKAQIYVTYGGYSQPWANNHVFYTADATVNQPAWSNLTGNLPNAPVNALALSGSTLFVGTDVGVFMASAGTKSWSSLNAGLPNTPVVGLLVTPDNKVIVATHGRGAFMTSIAPTDAQSTITVTPGNAQVQVGQTTQLKAQLTVSGQPAKDVTNLVSWKSYNPSVASVNSVGQITGRSHGTTTIVGTYNGQTVTVSVTVTPQIVNLAISPSPLAVQLGQTASVVAYAQYADGTFDDVTSQATWSTKSQSVATVDDEGLVTPVTKGSTSITVSFGGRTATIPVTVTPPVTSLAASLKVNNQVTNTIFMGQPATLSVTATYNDNTTGDVTSLANVVSVNGNVFVSGNKVTPLDKGDDSLDISFGGQSTSVDFTVKATLKNFSVDPKGPLSLQVNGTKQLTALATFNDGSAIDVTDDDNTLWTSSNPQVVKVDNGQITAVATGTAVITTTYAGQSPVKVNVTVTPDAKITSVSPQKVQPGQVVTITGQNFDGQGKVTIGGQPAQVKQWSATSVTAVVPQVGFGAQQVTLQPDGGGNTATYNGLTIVPAPPSVASVNPTQAYPGQSVTLTGANFIGSTISVTVGGVNATVTQSSATQLTITVPPVPAGKPPIVVAADGGKSPAFTGLTVLPSPIVTSVNPTSQVPGKTITISGSNFGTATGTVTVGGKAATVSTWTNTSITAIVPSVSGGKQPVIVSNAQGISSAPFANFTVNAPSVATLNVVDPVVDGVAGQQAVIVQVRALDSNGKPVAGQTLTFQTDKGSLTNATGVTNSNGIATVAVNYGQPGSVNFTATVGAATVSKTLNFSASAGNPPTMQVDGFSQDWISSGDPLSIYGSGFGSSPGNVTFHLGGQDVPGNIVSWTDQEIDVTVPDFNQTNTNQTDVTVTITAGTNTWTSPSGYLTLYTAPATPGIDGAYGPAADGSVVPGTYVFITGNGFGQEVGTVTLGGTVLTIDEDQNGTPRWTNTWIQALVPTGVPLGNNVPLKVTSKDGKTVLSVNVKVGNFPAILGWTPNSDGSITYHVVNFGTSGTVTVNGVRVSAVQWSAGQVTFSLPTGIPAGLALIEIQPLMGGAFRNTFPVAGTDTPDPTEFTSPQVYDVGTTTTGAVINGISFGDTQGAVLVNGQPVTVTTWTNQSITIGAPVQSGALIEVIAPNGLVTYYRYAPTSISRAPRVHYRNLQVWKR